jgi:hypothetical protein
VPVDNLLGVAPDWRWTSYRRRRTARPRVLLYGMQSSGASILATLASQWKSTLGIIDLFNAEVAPALDVDIPLVVKATAGPVHLEDHIASLQPTRTILVLRHPVDQISSLTRKWYRDDAIPIEAKLQEIDVVFQGRADFDLVVTYEDFVRHPSSTADRLRSIDIPLYADAQTFRRTLDEIIEYAQRVSEWSRVHWQTKWGAGAVRHPIAPLKPSDVPRAAEALTLARAHCPALLHYYEHLLAG